MSTLFVAAIIIGLVAAVCMVLASLDKKQKRKILNELLQRFSQLGSDHNLRFSSQEVLTNAVIGLDGLHRKLAVLQKRSETDFSGWVIDLNEIRSCSVKRHYGTIGAGDLQTKKPEQYLEKIVLHLVFSDGRDHAEVTFYNHIDHVIYQIRELEDKARHWELALSKMLVPENKRA